MGYVQGVYDIRNYDSLDAVLDMVYENMPNNYAKVVVIADNAGTTWGGSTYFAVIKRVDAEYGVVDFVSYNENGTALRKARFNGVWLPLEWGNPPMLLGVEYRTTERYLGKPVYVKLVDCGAMPNATIKTIAHGAQVLNAISCTLELTSTSGNHSTAPEINSDNTVSLFSQLYPMNIIIMANRDFSTYTAVAKIKYTKTTD